MNFLFFLLHAIYKRLTNCCCMALMKKTMRRKRKAILP